MLLDTNLLIKEFTMQAIEFIATKTKNSSIDIPQEFADKSIWSISSNIIIKSANNRRTSPSK